VTTTPGFVRQHEAREAMNSVAFQQQSSRGISSTPGMQEALATAGDFGTAILGLLKRYWSGDWGDLGEDDHQANMQALRDSSKPRLLAAYEVSGEKVWIITDAGWETTTVLLASEY